MQWSTKLSLCQSISQNNDYWSSVYHPVISSSPKLWYISATFSNKTVCAISTPLKPYHGNSRSSMQVDTHHSYILLWIRPRHARNLANHSLCKDIYYVIRPNTKNQDRKFENQSYDLHNGTCNLMYKYTVESPFNDPAFQPFHCYRSNNSDMHKCAVHYGPIFNS
jgi:hypothetical protein